MHTRLLTLATLTAIALPLAAQTKPAATDTATASTWEVGARARHDELVRQNGPGTDAALRSQLLAMGSRDQAARGFSGGKQVSAMTPDMIAKLPGIDTDLTKQLKQIVEQKGWPTIALVGIDASNAAMLILTHTADHAWQLKLLPQLEQFADTDKIDASSLALVIDKELVSEGKLQRYGTQFKFVNGAMAMFGVEDPANLDKRRARALLPPMQIYKEGLSQIYHLPVSKAIVSATSAQK